MRAVFVIAFATFFIGNLTYSQECDLLIKALKKNQVNRLFTFDSSKDRNEGFYEYHIIYLGTVHTSDKSYKIITEEIVWGIDRHTSGNIYVYDRQDQCVGHYHLGDGLDLPDKIRSTIPNRHRGDRSLGV
jgi:hypothetical protein